MRTRPPTRADAAGDGRRLPAGCARRPRRRGDGPLRLARPRRRDRRRGGARRSSARPPRSDPGSGPAATRSGTRCSPSSPISTGSPSGRMLDLTAVAARLLERAGVARSRRPACARAATPSSSTPTAATARAPAARPAWPGCDGDGRARHRSRPGADPRATSSGSASRRARTSRSSPRPSTSGPRTWGRWREAGVELVGENRLQDLEAKRERWGEALHLGLHRQPAEPQGQADPAAGPPDPLGRHRLGAGAARRARGRRTPRCWSR